MSEGGAVSEAALFAVVIGLTRFGIITLGLAAIAFLPLDGGYPRWLARVFWLLFNTGFAFIIAAASLFAVLWVATLRWPL